MPRPVRRPELRHRPHDGPVGERRRDLRRRFAGRSRGPQLRRLDGARHDGARPARDGRAVARAGARLVSASVRGARRGDGLRLGGGTCRHSSSSPISTRACRFAVCTTSPKRADHMHFCDRVEQMHELFRTMPPPVFDQLAKDIRPIASSAAGIRRIGSLAASGLATSTPIFAATKRSPLPGRRADRAARRRRREGTTRLTDEEFRSHAVSALELTARVPLFRYSAGPGCNDARRPPARVGSARRRSG